MYVNNEKTAELLKGLTDSNTSVGIENIDKFLQQQGVLVKVHVGRARNYIEVNPKIFGVDLDKSEELNEFFNQYIKNGKMTFIPMSDEKVLRNIEQKVRTMKDRTAIGYDGEFMPIEVYKEFKDYVSKAREEYLEARDSILSRWEILMDRFKVGLNKSLSEMNSLQKDTIYEQIIKRVPSKEVYKKSFYMDISLRAFPVAENLSILDGSISEEIRQSLVDNSLRSVYEIMGNILTDAFSTVNRLLVFFDKNEDVTRVASKTIESIKQCPGRLRKKNLIHNEFVEKIASKIDTLAKAPSVEDMAEDAENILALIYGFSNEMEFELPLATCVLDEETLSILYRAIKSS